MESQASPSSQSGGNKRVVTIVLVVVGVFLLLAIVGGILGFVIARKAAHRVGETIEDTSALLKDIGQYPDSYVQEGLPQYPGAEVTHLGRRDAKPTNGSITIVISTNDSVANVAAYYDQQLTSNGWVLKPASSTEASELVSRTYSKNNQEYSLVVQRSDEGTTATITWQAK